MKAFLGLLALFATSSFIGAGAAGCFGAVAGILIGMLTFGGFTTAIYREYENI